MCTLSNVERMCVYGGKVSLLCFEQKQEGKYHNFSSEKCLSLVYTRENRSILHSFVNVMYATHIYIYIYIYIYIRRFEVLHDTGINIYIY